MNEERMSEDADQYLGRMVYAGIRAFNAFGTGLEEYLNGNEEKMLSSEIKFTVDKIYKKFVEELPFPIRVLLKFQGKQIIDGIAGMLKEFVEDKTGEDMLKQAIRGYLENSLR